MHDGYFQVIAEPVSTWVHITFARASRQSARLVTKLKTPPRPSSSPGIPVLHGRVLHLGVLERHDLDHRRVQLAGVALRRGAALEVADVGALVGDDQRPLELPGVLGIDPEVGRELHRAAHARRHVDERAVGEHRRVQRRVEVVAVRHDGAEIFPHQLRMLAHRLGDRAEDHPGLGQLRLEGRADATRCRRPRRPPPCGPRPARRRRPRRRRGSSAP